MARHKSTKLTARELGGRCACGAALQKSATSCRLCEKKKKRNEKAAESFGKNGVSVDELDSTDLVSSPLSNAQWIFEQFAETVRSRMGDADIVEWAKRVVTLPPGDGWRGNQKLDFEHYPIAAEVLRMWKEPEVERLILLMGTQTGKSTIEMVILFDAMLRSGGNLIYTSPTEELKDKFPRTKILPIAESSPELGFHKSEQSNTLLRWQNGRFVWMALATSSQSMADTSGACTSIMPEYDEIPANMKHDPLALNFDRIRFSHRRKMLVDGTPRRMDSSGLYGLYQKSKMYVAQFPCPHCGEFFGVEKEDIKYPANVDPKEIKRLKLAWVECKSCGCEIADSYHMQMAKGAKLKCLNPEASGLWKGVRVPSWFSVKLTFSEAIFEFLEAESDLARLSDWWRSIAALPIDVYALNNIDGKACYEDRRSSAWRRGPMQIPADVRNITSGIDAGAGGFWFVLLGWGENGRKYVLWNAFYEARGTGFSGWDAAWKKVKERVALERFTYMGNGPSPVFRLGIIDSGFDAQYIYGLCKTTPKWLPTKGAGGLKTLYMRTNADPERKYGADFVGLPLVLNSTHHVHDILEKCLHTSVEEDHGIAFPEDEDKRIFAHLRGAVKKQTAHGSYIWEKTHKGAADHLRDALALAMLAGEIAGLARVVKKQDEKKKVLAPKKKSVYEPANTRSFSERN